MRGSCVGSKVVLHRARTVCIMCVVAQVVCVRETQRTHEAICGGNQTYGPYVRPGTCPLIPFASHPHVFPRVSVMGRVCDVRQPDLTTFVRALAFAGMALHLLIDRRLGGVVESTDAVFDIADVNAKIRGTLSTDAARILNFEVMNAMLSAFQEHQIIWLYYYPGPVPSVLIFRDGCFDVVPVDLLPKSLQPFVHRCPNAPRPLFFSEEDRSYSETELVLRLDEKACRELSNAQWLASIWGECVVVAVRKPPKPLEQQHSSSANNQPNQIIALHVQPSGACLLIEIDRPHLLPELEGTSSVKWRAVQTFLCGNDHRTVEWQDADGAVYHIPQPQIWNLGIVNGVAGDIGSGLYVSGVLRVLQHRIQQCAPYAQPEDVDEDAERDYAPSEPIGPPACQVIRSAFGGSALAHEQTFYDQNLRDMVDDVQKGYDSSIRKPKLLAELAASESADVPASVKLSEYVKECSTLSWLLVYLRLAAIRALHNKTAFFTPRTDARATERIDAASLPRLTDAQLVALLYNEPFSYMTNPSWRRGVPTFNSDADFRFQYPDPSSWPGALNVDETILFVCECGCHVNARVDSDAEVSDTDDSKDAFDSPDDPPAIGMFLLCVTRTHIRVCKSDSPADSGISFPIVPSCPCHEERWLFGTSS